MGCSTVCNVYSKPVYYRLRKLYLYGLPTARNIDDVTRINPRLHVER